MDMILFYFSCWGVENNVSNKHYTPILEGLLPFGHL